MTQETINLITAISGMATSLTLIATISSIWIAIRQMKKQSKLTNAANHIELRKMFSEPNRFMVHANLRPDGDWQKDDVKESDINWVLVDDYLGLFENCEKMLQDKVLDDDVFRNTYLYRLKNVLANSLVMSNKINNPDENWILFKELIDRYRNELKDYI